jgi:hypothetical protein
MKTAKAEKKVGMVTSLDGKRTIAVEEFDRLFDEGSDEIDQFVDWSKGRTITPRLLESAKVNVDFPRWVVVALDREADRIGVARQALIKLWIVERLEKSNAASGQG